MVENPLVTIITPAYNAAPFVSTAIQSVLDQTYPYWELFIIDDGSTDNTCKVVRSFHDPRIHLIHVQHSGLPAVARNVGLAHGKGNYVAFLDADDFWLPDKLALQVACLEANPAVGLVFSKFYVWVDGHKRPRGVLPDTRGLPNPGMLFPYLYERDVIGNSSAVVRRVLLDKHGWLDEDPQQRGTEDYELWLRLAPHSQFAFIDLPLYWYRVHSSNLSGNMVVNTDGRILALEKALKRHPEMRSLYPELVSLRMAAQKLLWLGYAQLIDGVDGCGRRDLLRSLRIWPFNIEAWGWLALSFLGPRRIMQLRRLSRSIW